MKNSLPIRLPASVSRQGEAVGLGGPTDGVAGAKVARFVAELAAVSLPNTFNPWRDICPLHDRVDAPAIRRRNLTSILESALASGAHALWVGRDLGHLGGRRTGLAITDELRLEAQAQMWGIPALTRATIGQPCGETTAREVWYWLEKFQRPTFLWNAFPLHPHRLGEPYSNRPHTTAEGEAGVHFLNYLYSEIQPRLVVALGRDAEGVLASLNIPHVYVRHPSMAGLNDFRHAMGNLLTRSGAFEGY